jgi:hypothetical protein
MQYSELVGLIEKCLLDRNDIKDLKEILEESGYDVSLYENAIIEARHWRSRGELSPNYIRNSSVFTDSKREKELNEIGRTLKVGDALIYKRQSNHFWTQGQEYIIEDINSEDVIIFNNSGDKVNIRKVTARDDLRGVLANFDLKE